jgi:hypothetical protein
MGLSFQLASGARTPLLPPGRGPALPRTTKVATSGSALPRARGRGPSAGCQPNNRIKCGLVGCAHPSQSMVCPTDTMVSQSVTETARHYALRAGRRRITVLCARADGV